LLVIFNTSDSKRHIAQVRCSGQPEEDDGVDDEGPPWVPKIIIDEWARWCWTPIRSA
jgi:hypothetical protein